MIPSYLARARRSPKLTFERVDTLPQTPWVYPAILTSLKLAHRLLEFRKGCSPLPQHEKSLPNICSSSNTLQDKFPVDKPPILTPSPSALLNHQAYMSHVAPSTSSPQPPLHSNCHACLRSPALPHSPSQPGPTPTGDWPL